MNRRDRRASRRADPDAVHLAVIRAAGPMVREQVQSAEAQGVDRSELVALVVDPASPIAPYFTKLPGPPLLAPDGSRVLLMLRSTAISPASMFSPEAQKRLIDPPDEGHVHCVHLARNQGYWTMLTWDEVPSSGWMH